MSKQITISQAEYDALKAKATRNSTVRFKVSEKGGVSVYGLNSRFPVTLYSGQWDRLIAEIPKLQEFMDQNRDSLAVKA